MLDRYDYTSDEQIKKELRQNQKSVDDLWWITGRNKMCEKIGEVLYYIFCILLWFIFPCVFLILSQHILGESVGMARLGFFIGLVVSSVLFNTGLILHIIQILFLMTGLFKFRDYKQFPHTQKKE